MKSLRQRYSRFSQIVVPVFLLLVISEERAAAATTSDRIMTKARTRTKNDDLEAVVSSVYLNRV